MLLEKAEKLYEEIRPCINLELKSFPITRESHDELLKYRDSRIELANKLVEETSSDFDYTRIKSGIDFPKASELKNERSNYIPDFFKGVQTVFFNINL